LPTLAAQGDCVVTNDVNAHGWGILIEPARDRR
jgi:hypothetical protein